MIGYKCTDKDGCCRGFKFEVGKTYTKDTPKEELKCCTDNVFHFCRELLAIERESNYKLSESRLFEVIAGDFVRDGDKYGTNSLTILREIKGEEKLELINSGNCNSGDCNSGNCNSGDCNSGNRNSGDWNSGNCNSGNCNSGDRNLGNCNSGSRNSGSRNSGSRNSGNFNSGDCNSGNFNSGDNNSGNCNSGNCNSGDRNSGNRNSGNFNSGDYNSGDSNSGFFNSDEPYVRMFNKMTDKKRCDIVIPSWCCFDLTVWVSHDTATEEEKAEHKAEIEVCGGFLKPINYKDAWRLAWNKASVKERKQLFKLPNWDNKVFEEITGIDAETEIAKGIKQ